MSFQGYLKADTETKVTIGPAVAVDDGFTPVVTLDISTADEAEIVQHNGSTVVDISAYTWAAITNGDGYYALTIASGALVTEGRLTVLINDDDLCLPIRADFMVVNSNVFDSLYAASTTDYLEVETSQAGALSGVALNLMVDRIYTRLFHEVNVTDADGSVEIRNTGDTGNIATGSITDDDTTTSQAKFTWA